MVRPSQIAALAKQLKTTRPDSTSIAIRLEGARSNATIEGADRLPGTTSYFIGNNPMRWHRGVPNYARVRYRNVYHGIDLVYYGKQRALEFDLDVAPKADPAAIRLAIDGADQTSLSTDGDLLVHTRTGDLALRRPNVYQLDPKGKRRLISARYRKASRNTVAIELAQYDRSRPLVIDPTLAYSTYIGNFVSLPQAIAVTPSGQAVIVGWEQDNAFIGYPTTSNLPHDSGNSINAIVSQFSADGSTLVYSAVFGGTKVKGGASGSGFDIATAVGLDPQGNIYLGGFTASVDFPTAKTSVPSGTIINQNKNPNVNSDAFVTKLNPSAAGTSNELVYSTYLGGTNFDYINSLAVDAGGNVYAVGGTLSIDFPTTASAFQQSNPAGAANLAVQGTLSKLAVVSGKVKVAYATYLGEQVNGLGHSVDLGGVAVDASSNAYITGYAGPGFPVTQGSFGGVLDGLVARVDTTASGTQSLKWASYIGGSAFDFLYGIAIVPGCISACNAYVTGGTSSSDFPIVGAAAQPNFAGVFDAFVAELAGADGSTIYSTYLGGVGYDFGTGIAVDASGDAYVAGTVESPDYPTVQALQSAIAGPDGDLFTTSDGGTTLDGVPGWDFSNIASNGLTFDPTTNPPTIYVGSFTGTGAEISVSTDNGNTFVQPAANGLSGLIEGLTYVPSNLGSPLLLAGTTEGLFGSGDGGQNFSAISSIPANRSVFFTLSQQIPNFTLVGTNNGAFFSTAGATNFLQADGLPSGTQVFSAAFDPQTCSNSAGITTCKAYLATDRGMFTGVFSSTGQVSFLSATKYNFTSVFGVAVDPTTTPSTVYGVDFGDPVVASKDGFNSNIVFGSGFSSFFNIGTSVAVDLRGSNPAPVYVGSDFQALSEIYASTDGGATFAFNTAVSGNFRPLQFAVPGTATLYAAEDTLFDEFVTELDTTGSHILFSTFMGGSDVEDNHGLALDPGGNLYVAGTTSSDDFPTAGTSPFQTQQKGLINGTVIKINGLPTGTPTPTATATPTSVPTPTPIPTATATATPAPPPSPTATPRPTPTMVCPALSSEFASDAAKAPKLPKIKPLKFPPQALGTTSSPITITLPQTAGLVVSGVTPSGDFMATNTCVGQPLPCSISISFRPSGAGTRRGTLTIANNLKTISATLSGSGIGPKVKSLSEHSLPPLQPLTLNGSGFAPDSSIPLLVNFTEKLKKSKQTVSLLVAASSKTLSSVQVPPIYDPIAKKLAPGTATIELQEVLNAQTTLTSKSPPLQIAQLNQADQLPPGAVSLGLLMAEQQFAMQLEQDVMNTALSSLGPSLMQSASALQTIIGILSGGSNPDLGTIGGMDVTESDQNLLMADEQILQMLQTMAGNSTTSASRIRADTGSGCLAAEAAQALADEGNVTNFDQDMVKFFQDSETSPACMQPGAAIATLGIVNGAGAVALSVLTAPSNPSTQGLLAPEALLQANLSPGGQLLGIGTTLAQTTPQARQQVENAVVAFNQASNPQLGTVIGQTQGALGTPYASNNQTAMSFNSATPAPLDGSYSGSFSGTQFASNACPGPISGSIGFTVAGGVVTVTVPGAGSGTLDGTGAADFQPGGIGGANVSCSFGGVLLPNQTGPASGAGTWSCTSTGAGSDFNSANGTWNATTN